MVYVYIAILKKEITNKYGRGLFFLDVSQVMSLCSWARIFRRLFSKRCTYGSKSGTKSLVRQGQIRINFSRAFEGLSYLADKIKKTTYV